MKNKEKELRKKAMEIVRLEKELTNGNTKETEEKIMNIISKMSLEEIIMIDNYILEKLEE